MEQLSGTDGSRSGERVAVSIGRLVGVIGESVFQTAQTRAFLLEKIPYVGLANKDGKSQNTRERFDDVDGVSRFSQCSGSVSNEFGNPRDDFEDEQSEYDT